MLGDHDDLFAILRDFDAPRLAPQIPLDPLATQATQSSYAYTAFREVYGYDAYPQPHLEAAQFIDTAMGDYRFASGGQQLYMIGWPRGTFKTTFFAQGLPSLVLGRNPNARILISSFRHDVSKRRLRAIKQDLEFNPRFHARFGDGWKPEFREDIWNDDAIYVMRRTDRTIIDPSVACGGVDRSMTGAHFDLIIGDDLVTDTNVRTAEMRDKVYSYILDLLPILEPNGVLILIFTRWHVDDAYGRLIRLDERRLREGRTPVFTKTIRKAHNPDGTLFFPARLTEDFLQDQRDRLGSRKYAAQYDNEPMADEDRTFSMELRRVRAFDFVARRLGGGYVQVPGRGQQPVLTTLAWDPMGRKPSTHSDSHGITVVGTDKDDLRWVCEARSYKGRPSEAVGVVINLLLYYKIWALSCETDGGGGLWIDLLKSELARRALPCPWIHEYATGGVPKNERIAMAVQPRWERGGYILRPDQHTLLAQIEQFSVGTVSAHEDVLDSLAQHESFARQPEGYEREDDNPVDPEYAVFAKNHDAIDAAGGRTSTRWDVGVGSSLTRSPRDRMIDPILHY